MSSTHKASLTLIIACLIWFFPGGGVNAVNPEGTASSIRVQNPFSIEIDPMLRLLLINFENDPDSIYIGFEPQVFADSLNGTGHLVIGWRKDGRVDVYCQPGMHPDPAKYDIAGKGLANMINTEMHPAFYDVGEKGVQAQYVFKDLHGREIELVISERHPARRHPFGLLAPMGSSTANPSSFPLILLHDFYFVRQAYTDFRIRIGERLHKPDKLPMLIDWRKQYFTRYSPSPLIATFNPSFSGQLPDLLPEEGATTLRDGDLLLELVWKNGMPSIGKIIRDNAIHPIELAFHPPFPAMDSVQPGARIRGDFQITAHPSTGRVGGRYSLFRDGELIELTLRPDKGWKPRADKPSLRFLYSVARVFKSWPKTYRWDATLIKDADGTWQMQSNWTRVR